MRTLTVAGVHGDNQVRLSRAHWLRLLSGLVAIFALFQWIAAALHSDRGQAGVIVAITVVSATLIAQRWLYGGTLIEAAKSLGLGVPRWRGVVAACASCATLAIAQTIFVTGSGAVVTYDAGSRFGSSRAFLRRAASQKRLFFAAICSVTCADASRSGGRGSRR